MKNKIIYLLPLLLVLIAGCTKKYNDPDKWANDSGYPLGMFTGTFIRIHKNPVTLKYDTITAALKLVLSTNTGFAVSGDTTIHAGSYGSFKEDITNIWFIDVTSPVNYTPKKTHLSGTYTYTYNRSYLMIENAVKSDTLSCVYHLTKMKY